MYCRDGALDTNHGCFVACASASSQGVEEAGAAQPCETVYQCDAGGDDAPRRNSLIYVPVHGYAQIFGMCCDLVQFQISGAAQCSGQVWQDAMKNMFEETQCYFTQQYFL